VGFFKTEKKLPWVPYGEEKRFWTKMTRENTRRAPPPKWWKPGIALAFTRDGHIRRSEFLSAELLEAHDINISFHDGDNWIAVQHLTINARKGRTTETRGVSDDAYAIVGFHRSNPDSWNKLVQSLLGDLFAKHGDFLIVANARAIVGSDLNKQRWVPWGTQRIYFYNYRHATTRQNVSDDWIIPLF
jgi:hypothetical protein